MALDGPFNPSYRGLQTVRASAVLAPAGAVDETPLELYCPCIQYVTFYMSYTRAGAAGAFDFYIEASPYSADVAGVEDWFRQAIVAGGAVAVNNDSVSNIQREVVTYGAVTANIENFVYGPVEIQATIERIRVPCCESGNTGAPGTVHIVAVFS